MTDHLLRLCFMVVVSRTKSEARLNYYELSVLLSVLQWLTKAFEHFRNSLRVIENSCRYWEDLFDLRIYSTSKSIHDIW